MHYGFPSGDTLIREVRAECKKVEGKLYNCIANTGHNNKEVIELGQVIDRTNFRSIDALLSTYTEFVEVGKLLIAVCLLPKEEKDAAFSAEKRSTNWMLYLFEKMQGQRLEHFALNRVTFVTFNYDRSLEYFLRRQLRDCYPKSSVAEVEEVLRGIKIIHVHGQLGGLDQVEYGVDHLRYGGAVAKKAASGIRIVHEADSESIEFKNACFALEDAERVGILGFGYLSENMDRLRFAQTLSNKYVVGTCKGRTKPELNDVRSRIRGGMTYEAFLDGDCVDLLRQTELIL